MRRSSVLLKTCFTVHNVDHLEGKSANRRSYSAELQSSRKVRLSRHPKRAPLNLGGCVDRARGRKSTSPLIENTLSLLIN